MLVFPALTDMLPRSKKLATEIHLTYAAGHGLLRVILIRCTELRFAVQRVSHGEHDLSWGHGEGTAEDEVPPVDPRTGMSGRVSLTMLVKGKRPISHLIASLSDNDGVREVGLFEHEGPTD